MVEAIAGCGLGSIATIGKGAVVAAFATTFLRVDHDRALCCLVGTWRQTTAAMPPKQQRLLAG